MDRLRQVAQYGGIASESRGRRVAPDTASIFNRPYHISSPWSPHRPRRARTFTTASSTPVTARREGWRLLGPVQSWEEGVKPEGREARGTPRETQSTSSDTRSRRSYSKTPSRRAAKSSTSRWRLKRSVQNNPFRLFFVRNPYKSLQRKCGQDFFH